MKLIKKAAFLLIPLLVIGFGITYVYIYKDHRDVSKSKTFKSFDAEELHAIFNDSNLSNDKEILDQVIEVSGTITDQSKSGIVINNNIFVVLIQTEDANYEGKVTIKGRCLGYDDLLEEVKIDEATLITNKN